jgi:hypothetical protein
MRALARENVTRLGSGSRLPTAHDVHDARREERAFPVTGFEVGDEGGHAVGLDLATLHEVGQDRIGVAHGAVRGEARDDKRVNLQMDVDSTGSAEQAREVDS